MAGPLGMEMASGYAAQFIVDERHQAIERVPIPVLPFREKARDLPVVLCRVNSVTISVNQCPSRFPHSLKNARVHLTQFSAFVLKLSTAVICVQTGVQTGEQYDRC